MGVSVTFVFVYIMCDLCESTAENNKLFIQAVIFKKAIKRYLSAIWMHMVMFGTYWTLGWLLLAYSSICPFSAWTVGKNIIL